MYLLGYIQPVIASYKTPHDPTWPARATLKVAPKQYSWIAQQMDIGISLVGRHNLVQFQTWGHFWIPQPKLHGECYLLFFVKPQNDLVWPVFFFRLKKVLWRFFWSELRALFELNSMWKRYARQAKSEARYQRKSIHLSTFCWYAQARADQLDFLN